MKVLVVKTGGTWHGEGSGSVSTLTSQHNHTAVARFIAEAGHDVVLGGRISGDIVCQVGYNSTQFGWAVRPEAGLDEGLRECERWTAGVEAWKPDVLVNVTGSEQTCYSPNNPRDVSVLDASWRYGWVMHEMLKRLPLPRIAVVTDCRTYPREHEMVWGPPAAIPVAVLSQEDCWLERRIIGTRFKIKACYAGIERLRTRWTDPLPWNSSARGCVALAHAHSTDARIKKLSGVPRERIWSELIGSGVIDAVHGEGWDAHKAIPHAEVLSTLNQYACGPLLPMQPGWVSPKYREYALAGCAPLVWYEYDSGGCCVPLDDVSRFNSADQLGWLAARCSVERNRFEAVEQALHASDSNAACCQKLLEAIEWFGRGNGMDLEQFGGYERC